MTAMPFGFMGAVFGHLIFNLPMALFSYFGIGAAAGVVVNDNLVLIDYVRRLEREGIVPASDCDGRSEPLSTYFLNHAHHVYRLDSDYGRAIHQRRVFEACGVVAGFWGVFCAVCEPAAGARDVSHWS